MALAPLVTGDQVLDRLGRQFTAVENARIDALIGDVSAAVRADTGQQFTAGSSTALLRISNFGAVRPPQQPITDVTSVTDVLGNDLLYWWWAGDSEIRVGSSWYLNVWELNVPPFGRFDKVRVTYTHGYEPTIPDDVIAVVCAIVCRSIAVAPDGGSGQIIQESIAGYSYTLKTTSASGPFGITDDERTILDRYKQPAGAISLMP